MRITCTAENDGFEKRTWQVGEITDNSVTLLMKDGDGQQGYPPAISSAV